MSKQTELVEAQCIGAITASLAAINDILASRQAGKRVTRRKELWAAVRTQAERGYAEAACSPVEQAGSYQEARQTIKKIVSGEVASADELVKAERVVDGLLKRVEEGDLRGVIPPSRMEKA